jgi:hypothetical protein
VAAPWSSADPTRWERLGGLGPRACCRLADEFNAAACFIDRQMREGRADMTVIDPTIPASPMLSFSSPPSRRYEVS